MVRSPTSECQSLTHEPHPRLGRLPARKRRYQTPPWSPRNGAQWPAHRFLAFLCSPYIILCACAPHEG